MVMESLILTDSNKACLIENFDHDLIKQFRSKCHKPLQNIVYLVLIVNNE